MPLPLLADPVNSLVDWIAIGTNSFVTMYDVLGGDWGAETTNNFQDFLHEFALWHGAVTYVSKMAGFRNVSAVGKRSVFSVSVLGSRHNSYFYLGILQPVVGLRPSLHVQRSIWSSSRQDDLTQALSDAEKLVGYPTSFLNLRYLLSDEISNVAMYMKRFAMSKHPLLRTARGFISDENHTLQTRGLLVLLISKASRPFLKDDCIVDQELVADIYSSQRQLADITETIYTGKEKQSASTQGF